MLFFRLDYVALSSIATILFISTPSAYSLLPYPPLVNTATATSCSIVHSSIPQEAKQVFTKAANTAVSHEYATGNTHQVSDVIKSASYQLFLESQRMEDVEHKLDILNADLHHKANDIGHEIGYMMVKGISAILPHVDSIGHKVLHMDDEIINYFINLDNLSPELKKRIILGIIHISQQGDHFGAQMLQLYYDIVNKLM